ncbi:MAG TPA: hypothetical protein VE988_01800 [Gemmataceae bacterium]|nr:hypothetical protein [Gemmataceae bacterium]
MHMTKVACPLCHGVSPVGDASPVGKSIHCQKCGAPFTITAADLCASKNGSAVQGNGTPMRNGTVAQARLKAPPVARMARQAPATPDGSHKVVAIGMVVGGLTLVLAVSAALAFIALSGDPKPDERASVKPPVANVLPPPVTNKTPDPDPEPPPADDPSPGFPEEPQQQPAKDAAPQKEPDPKPVPKPAAPKPDRHGITPEQQKNIDDAISKGVAYLKTRQHGGSWDAFSDGGPKGKGYPLGPTALAGLTLLECGVPTTDKRILEAAKYVRDQKIWGGNGHTYEISLAILFLDKLGDKNDKKIIQALALRLLNGQARDEKDVSNFGGWTYDCRVMDNKEATAFLTGLEKTRPKPPPTAIDIDKGAKTPLPIPVDKNKSGGSSYDSELIDSDLLRDEFMPVALLQQKGQPPKGQKKGPVPKKDDFKGPRADNSNTQFAMLAVWVARRHGIPTEAALARCEKRFRASQFASGNWGYHFDDQARQFRPSMTCVGLLGIALGKGSTAELSLRGAKPDPKKTKPVPIDDQVRRGINALHLDSYQLQGKQWPGDLSLYFVWSVERIGVLYDLTHVGGNQDWYKWGVGVLLPTQQNDGRWDTASYHGANAIHDTCFALLFLKRVNLAQDLTDLNLFMGITDPNQIPKGP